MPQGSVLGPLLFLIYIDGVTRIPLSEGSKLVLYADDMLLFRRNSSPVDFNILQSDVDAVNNWVNENHLCFNTTKCKYMLITRKKRPRPMHPPAILINGILGYGGFLQIPWTNDVLMVTSPPFATLALVQNAGGAYIIIHRVLQFLSQLCPYFR